MILTWTTIKRYALKKCFFSFPTYCLIHDGLKDDRIRQTSNIHVAAMVTVPRSLQSQSFRRIKSTRDLPTSLRLPRNFTGFSCSGTDEQNKSRDWPETKSLADIKSRPLDEEAAAEALTGVELAGARPALTGGGGWLTVPAHPTMGIGKLTTHSAVHRPKRM